MSGWLLGLNNARDVALALTAVGACLLGIWHYILRPTKKFIEAGITVYKSIGNNGRETLFEVVHRIDRKQDELDHWRMTVDLNLEKQNRMLDAQDAVLETLLERGEQA